MDMEDLIRQMEAMSGEELYQQFFRERRRVFYYEGPLSTQESGSFWGVRLDGVKRGDTFPEDCVFLDELLVREFLIRPGKWTEQARNRFRIIVEQMETDNG